MPVVVIDLKMPAALEDGMDRVVVQMRRLKRRLQINWSRRLSILRYGLRSFLEAMRKTEDKKPILKREDEYSSFKSQVYFAVVRQNCWLHGC